jgi:outer membrane protein assembly factor BamB
MRKATAQMIRKNITGQGSAVRRCSGWRHGLLVCMLIVPSSLLLAQSLGFQITPDHQGQLYFPGMNPPLSQRWAVVIGSIASYPIVLGNRVFVIAGYPTSLLALDAQTGTVLWSQTVPQDSRAWSGVAYENGVLFVDSQQAYYRSLSAFSAIDGHQLWSTSLPGQYSFWGAPTASNGVVYVDGSSYGGTLYAVREYDGTLLWTASSDGNSTPAITSEGVYVSYSCDTMKFAPATGQQIWRENYNCYGGYGVAPPVYRGRAYAFASDFYLPGGIILSTANGSYLGEFNSAYVPTFWQNTIFYTQPQFVAAIDLTTSFPLWVAVVANDAYTCPPLAVNGILYAATYRGNVYGYTTDTGNQIFSANAGQGISCPERQLAAPIGMTAGDGLLVVPAGSKLVAYQFTNFGHWQFVPVSPCRLVDTRQTHNPIQGGTTQNYNVPQLGGCNIPGSATAYSLNVTVVPRRTLGYLTVWPTGEQQPSVSTMNSYDGRVKANAAVVPAGYQDNVSVYATDTTDVILDVNGYFTPPASGTYQFYPLTPCRVIDTRNPVGPLGGPRLEANSMRDFPVRMSSCIPSGASPIAYSFNVTVVPNPSGQPLNYLTVYPAGQSQVPVASTLNNPKATVVANAAIVPAGTGGDIEAYAYNSTDMIVDINGYFAAPGTGGLSLYPASPCRVLDTRNGSGAFHGDLNPPVNVVNSACAPPPQAQAYVLNATVVPSGVLDYLTLWPDGENEPSASTLNAWDGAVTSNMAIVPTNNGIIDAFADGTTQLILDISSYFAP